MALALPAAGPLCSLQRGSAAHQQQACRARAPADLASSCFVARPAAVRQRLAVQMPQHVAQSSLAGAGGINDDNKERVVKGEVGDPSKAQPLVSKHTFAVAATATHAVDVVGYTVMDTLQTFLTRFTHAVLNFQAPSFMDAKWLVQQLVEG